MNIVLAIGALRLGVGDALGGVVGMIIALATTVWSWQALHDWLGRLDDWRDGVPQQPFMWRWRKAMRWAFKQHQHQPKAPMLTFNEQLEREARRNR